MRLVPTCLALATTAVTAGAADITAHVTDKAGSRRLFTRLTLFCNRVGPYALPNRYSESLNVAPAESVLAKSDAVTVALATVVRIEWKERLPSQLGDGGPLFTQGFVITTADGKSRAVIGDGESMCKHLLYEGPPLTGMFTGKEIQPRNIYRAAAFVEGPSDRDPDPILPPADGRHFIRLPDLRLIEVAR